MTPCPFRERSTGMEKKRNRVVDHSVLCIGALLGSSGSAGREGFRGHEGRAGVGAGAPSRRSEGAGAARRRSRGHGRRSGPDGRSTRRGQASRQRARRWRVPPPESTFELEGCHPRLRPAAADRRVRGWLGLFSGGRSGIAGSAGLQGAKQRGGDGHRPIPGGQASASPKARRLTPAQQKVRRPATTHRWCQRTINPLSAPPSPPVLDHARLDEYARLVDRDRHVEHLGEHFAFQMGQPSCPIGLFRLQIAVACRASRCAADRIRPARQSRHRTASGVQGTDPSPSLCSASCSLAGACPAGCCRYRKGATYQAGMLFQRNAILVHDGLRFLGRNCPGPEPARRSAAVTGSQTAAGRQRAQHAQTLTARTVCKDEGNQQASPPRTTPALVSAARRPAQRQATGAKDRGRKAETARPARGIAHRAWRQLLPTRTSEGPAEREVLQYSH